MRTGITNNPCVSLDNKENETIYHTEYQDIPAQLIRIDLLNVEIKFEEIGKAEGKPADKKIQTKNYPARYNINMVKQGVFLVY